MRLLKNLIALSALASIAVLIFQEIKFMIIIAMILVVVWLYLDFTFCQEDNK